MTAPFLETSSLCIRAPGGRPLFDGLDVRLEREHVALIGRNGAGKSTLLSVLAGLTEPHSGRIRRSSAPHLVPQLLPRDEASGGSHGEQRRRALLAARNSGREFLLLDEPTEDLDADALEWLRGWLGEWPGCLVVASHDRRLLTDFRHFFVVSESGCRYFTGSLAELEATLEAERVNSEQRYVRNLNRLAHAEARDLQIESRKARKKRSGRARELDRATPRIRLNEKRSQAQVSHGRLAVQRQERLDALRNFSQATRRALAVRLSVDYAVPTLPPEHGAVLSLQDVAVCTPERTLFRALDLHFGRERVGVVGPNGAGKTTLLELALGRRSPSAGTSRCDRLKVGSIAQGAADWLLDESLVELLRLEGVADEEVARVLLAHTFPLALAHRSLHSLSPGERTRAALIGLFQRKPTVELLVLDEPTFSLDLLGQRALADALRAWQGGLLVASHDRDFLASIGVKRLLELGQQHRGAER